MAKEASTFYEWLIIVIKRGVIVTRNRSIIKCYSEETFGAIVGKVVSEYKGEKVVRVVICATESFIDVHKVSSDAPVSVFRLFNCKHCCIYLEDSPTTATLSAVEVHKNPDAFSVLMANSR